MRKSIGRLRAAFSFGAGVLATIILAQRFTAGAAFMTLCSSSLTMFAVPAS
jgi:hypothetical protein